MPRISNSDKAIPSLLTRSPRGCHFCGYSGFCFNGRSRIRRRPDRRWNRSNKAFERMRILCTNDDGIHAPGLKIVEEIARALSDDVWIVAPELDQSGVSHSLSLNDPVRLREVARRNFAVRGTPTDCVIMGARHILGETMPDLVLSGVNKGRNVAEDVV